MFLPNYVPLCSCFYCCFSTSTFFLNFIYLLRERVRAHEPAGGGEGGQREGRKESALSTEPDTGVLPMT